jgi:predicted NUDIX family NTP pyrophosphohydrolase
MLKIQKNHPRLVIEENKDYQVGVFAYTETGKVVLVTSRKGESWILPKGNRAKKRSDRIQAKREAFEEAGLQGSLNYKHYDFKSSENGKRIRIYSMRVKKILNSFPEKMERKRVVISFDQAEKMVKKEYLAILCELSKRII